MRSVDDLERPIVLTPLAGDEEDVDLAALQRPNGVVDAVGDADELEMRVVGQGSLHVEGVQPFDGDECADKSVSHLGATSPACFAWPGREASSSTPSAAVSSWRRPAVAAGTRAFPHPTRTRASGQEAQQP